MKKVFSRYEPAMDRTFALRAFNAHESEINRHYWSFKAISDYSSYIARGAKKADSTMPTAELFHASGPDAVRIPPTVSDWLIAKNGLENWLRLATITSASSYFEIYLKQVAISALQSDPICKLGARRAVDGLLFLKRKNEPDLRDDITSLTKGHWPSRVKQFKILFGSVPDALTKNVDKLDKIRILRNKFSHGFGRELEDAPNPSNQFPGTSSTLQSKVLLEYLGLLSKIAASVDKFLLSEFIGNYELLHFYHEWHKKPQLDEEKLYAPHRAFQRALQKNRMLSANADFCKELIKYYDKVDAL